MKILFTILLSFSIAFLYAQSGITEDTSRANALFEQAIALDDEDERAVELLEQAFKLYEPYGFYKKQVVIKGQLASNYSFFSDSLCELNANEALKIGIEHLDTLHPPLFQTYSVLQDYYSYYIPEKSIYYGKKAFKLADISSKRYPVIITHLMSEYAYDNKGKELKIFIDNFEEQIKLGKIPKRFETLIFRGKMQLNNNYRNYESAIIYGEQCIISNEESKIFTIEILGPICVEIGKTYGRIKKLHEGIKWMEKGVEYAKGKITS